MSKYDDIAILILAAGESTRMSRPKQLLSWKSGTLLGNVIETALKVNPRNVFVVLGAHEKAIKEKVDLKKVISIYNADYKNGQGSSLSCGAHLLLDLPSPHKGILVLLGDQPLITTAYLDEIIDTFKSGKSGIVASDYGNKAGVPAIFAWKYLSEIAEVDEDFGAKNILRKYSDDCTVLPANGLVADIDTPEDYEKLIKNQFGRDS